MVVEIAITLALVALSSLFLYASFNLERQHTSLRIMFFLLSLISIYATLATTSYIATTTTERQLANSTFNQVTGLTEYSWSETHPYEGAGDILASMTFVDGVVIFIVFAYFFMTLFTSLMGFIVGLFGKR